MVAGQNGDGTDGLAASCSSTLSTLPIPACSVSACSASVLCLSVPQPALPAHQPFSSALRLSACPSAHLPILLAYSASGVPTRPSTRVSRSCYTWRPEACKMLLTSICIKPPSSSGLRHHPFKVATRVQIPLGVLTNLRCSNVGSALN